MSEETLRQCEVLDAAAPGLDDLSRRRRRVLAGLVRARTDQVFEIAVRAGIYTSDGELTADYRDDAEPSSSRPSD